MYELPPPPLLTSVGDVDDWCIRCERHRPTKPKGLCPVCIDEEQRQ